MLKPIPHRILTGTALSFAVMLLDSCRPALHTLTDYVGKKEFVVAGEQGEGYEVYRCEEVLYVKLPGYYVRPRVALVESYNLKAGCWQNGFEPVPAARSHEAVTLFLPLNRELV